MGEEGLGANHTEEMEASATVREYSFVCWWYSPGTGHARFHRGCLHQSVASSLYGAKVAFSYCPWERGPELQAAVFGAEFPKLGRLCLEATRYGMLGRCAGSFQMDWLQSQLTLSLWLQTQTATFTKGPCSSWNLGT